MWSEKEKYTVKRDSKKKKTSKWFNVLRNKKKKERE